MPIAVTEEQLAVQAAIRDWAKRTGTISLVRGLEPVAGTVRADTVRADTGQADTGQAGVARAGLERVWDELSDLGVFAVALPEAVGGAGGSVADQAAALEELTLALTPGPILPTVLAALALAPVAAAAPAEASPEQASTAARDLLPAIAAGKARVTVVTASSPNAPLTGTWQADGTLRVSGETGPVLSGGPGAHLLVRVTAGNRTANDSLSGSAAFDPHDWFLVPDSHPGVTVTERSPVDFSRPLSTIGFTDAVIEPRQIISDVSTERVRALTAALFSVEAAAVARWACDTAAAYARTRHQFGRPIGSFQAVKHLCATMACRAEEAAALTWDAVRAADEAPGEFPLAAAAAAGKALDNAVDNAKDCVQVLGGIGFTWEHDAHLYLRRALAVARLAGGGAAWRERTAALALAGARRHLSLAVTGPAAEAAREIAREVAALPEADRRRLLAAKGYVAPGWPAPYGLDAPAGDILAIDEELGNEGLSRPDLVIGGWAGEAVVQFGTPEQLERFIGPTIRGEITWCQLFSEPEAGSDLASLRTRAVKIEGGWKLTGQKVWTSLAHEADWAICLARTDPSVPKHKGLTYFLVDMRGAGLDIRPLREITGREMFNEAFLDDVFVPDDRVLGEPGSGWKIARATLAAERVAMGRGSSFGEDVERLLGQVRAAGLTADARTLEKIGGLVSGALSGSLLEFRLALSQVSRTPLPHLAPIRKLLGVAHRQAVAETALALCGPEGAASDGTAAEPVYEFLLSRCLSIAGGSTQILLSVVAERVLGLPREDAR
ncbi:MAG TPA: acyl-CoA dehydrogenase [Trebonia sp.]